MGIFSTHDYLSREEIIKEIGKRVPDIRKMCNERLVSVLEAMCQVIYDVDEDLNDELAYNNFSIPKETE